MWRSRPLIARDCSKLVPYEHNLPTHWQVIYFLWFSEATCYWFLDVCDIGSARHICGLLDALWLPRCFLVRQLIFSFGRDQLTSCLGSITGPRWVQPCWRVPVRCVEAAKTPRRAEESNVRLHSYCIHNPVNSRLKGGFHGPSRTLPPSGTVVPIPPGRLCRCARRCGPKSRFRQQQSAASDPSAAANATAARTVSVPGRQWRRRRVWWHGGAPDHHPQYHRHLP